MVTLAQSLLLFYSGPSDNSCYLGHTKSSDDDDDDHDDYDDDDDDIIRVTIN